MSDCCNKCGSITLFKGTNGDYVQVTPEPAGANCADGGIKVEVISGVDNTTVKNTQYVCDGADGATGATGATGPAGPAGADGQGIDHVSFTSSTGGGGAGQAGETDTYTVWGDVGETINLGTFLVYNGANGTGGGSTSGNAYSKLVTNQTIGSTRLVQADGTTEILVSSLLIPANTFGVSDVLTVKLWSELNAGAATIAHRMYINSSAAIGGSMILGNLTSENITPAASTLSQYIERELSIENATNTYYPSDGGTLTGWQQSISTSTGGVSPGFKSANIDWTVNQYLIFTCQFNSAPGVGEYGDIRYMSINN
jgi:hypothetical protein